MEEKLNIAEILKDAPKGIKLWSPIYGDCEFVGINDDNDDYPVVCKVRLKGHHAMDDYAYFSPKGEYCIDYDNNECILFPSKENRDWSTFKVTEKHKRFEPFEKVLVKVFREGRLIWTATFYSHYDKAACQHLLVGGFIRDDDDIIPYEGNEDMVGKKAE